jgi:hypothetical protein
MAYFRGGIKMSKDSPFTSRIEHLGNANLKDTDPAKVFDEVRGLMNQYGVKANDPAAKAAEHALIGKGYLGFFEVADAALEGIPKDVGVLKSEIAVNDGSIHDVETRIRNVGTGLGATGEEMGAIPGASVPH